MRYLFLTSFAVTALATAAFAQGGGMGMLRADTNNDGMISKAEAEAQAGARFDAMDVNKDGFLAPEEMTGPGARMMGRAGGPDGKVSRAEYIARADKRFARLDTNGDGMLSREELKAGMDRMRGAMGQRGAVDPADAVAPPPPPPPLPPKPGQ